MLFPAAAAKPLALLAAWLVPQALLFGLNASAWNLASGEVNDAERAVAIRILATEIAAFLVGLLAFFAAAGRGRPLNRGTGLLLLLSASVYLAVAVINAGAAIPDSISDWILPENEWVFKQFALVMPGALYGAFRFLCPDDENRRLAGLTGSLLAAVSPFAILGLAMFAGWLITGMAVMILAPVYIAASTLLVAAILRLCASGYVAARRSSPGALLAFTAVLAVALPLGGLMLNAKIPFPVDFQIPILYGLAVANGLLLCLPNFAHPLAHRAVWLLQCASFPFTLYFFAVFLPWLPLMPLAIFFVGLGVLMAVPSALFLLHGYRLLDGWRAEIRDGSRWVPAVLGALAFSAGPAFVTGRILADRAALHAGLDFLTYPDYAKDTTFPGDPRALRSALLRMRDFKAGNYLPYYSEFYNALAFDRLVLPKARIEETWKTFANGPMPAAREGSFSAPMFSNRGRSAQEVLEGPVGARPSSRAVLASLRTETSFPGAGTVRARVRLTVQNPTAETTEFFAPIHVPDGVFITGLRLTIGAEDVPARLFEQRAAEWVYQKITEARPVPRDPAILRFVGPNQADLRIYPVDARGTRTAEIEFTYPDNLAPAIAIDGQALSLPAPTNSFARTTSREGRVGAWIPRAVLEGFPPLAREPEPHLVLDVSHDSDLREPEKLRAALEHALALFPRASSARVFFANYNFTSYRDGAAIPVAELACLDPAAFAPAASFAGGFLEIRAVKSALAHAARADDASRSRFYPAVVIVRGSASPPVKADDAHLAEFARLAPDAASYWRVASAARTPEQVPLNARATPAVHLGRLGTRSFVVPAGEDAFLSSEGTDASLAVWNDSRQAFEKIPAQPADRLATSAAAWNLATNRILSPSDAGPAALSRLVDRARTAGTLVPGTALMVVENSAQWKMLERTEKKALGGHDALSLSEAPPTVPEPSTTALIVLAVVAAAIARRRQILARPR